MLTLYETYYKLSADPFRLSPDHRFAFGHRSYARAKAYLEYALHRGEGFITITGSAGTGKTTLISAWVAHCERLEPKVRAAWLSLDEGDNDPARFLAYMIAALRTIEANIGKGVLSALQSPQPPPAESVLISLINEVAALPGSVILIFDAQTGEEIWNSKLEPQKNNEKDPPVRGGPSQGLSGRLPLTLACPPACA